jgi:FtsP/CotA-like multicopper oxidase with cupredoxin domain
MKRLLFISVLFVSEVSFAAILNTQLWLNRGSFLTVSSTSFPFLAFNNDSTFNPLNKVVIADAGDTIVLHVHNHDSIPHGFAVRGIGSSGIMAPGDSLTDTITSASERVFIYYDDLNYPDFRYLGAAGMICFQNAAISKNYYWNLKEHQTSFNNQLASGGSVNWSQYEPDYFTFNSLSHPDVLADTLSHITANVGDTIHLFITNTGQSLHSLHFHGFHGRVIYSSSPRIMTNSSKSTFPVESMESVILEFIFDKPGQYSVHDHNIVAVSGGNMYPNGMLTIMDIQ